MGLAYHGFMDNRHVKNRVAISILQIRVGVLGPQQSVAVKMVGTSSKGQRVLAIVHAT